MIINKELSIYVHIPFCMQKCYYCDFFSAPQSEEKREEYVVKLVDEIKTAAGAYQEYQIKTVFFGGGTPSVLSWRQTERIMDALHNNYRMEEVGEVIETTIEVNPGTVTKEKLNAYKSMGFNRLSIGLQSANNEELKTLGRIHTYEDFLECVNMARETGFSNLNMDVMSALPGQTEASYEDTLQKVIRLNPEHISAYSLILEEGTLFYDWYGTTEKQDKQMKKLPTEEEERRMYERTKELLFQYGYERYEISNYAKKGFECKHNNVYWKRGNYLGFGSTAASMVDNVRFTNGMEKRHLLSIKEQQEEFIFLGMRRMKGVSKQEFKNQFGYPIEQCFETALRKMERLELIKDTGSHLYLTDKGIDVSNYVFSEFLLD